MNPFLRSTIIGTVIYTVLFFLPGINGFLGWITLFLGGFLYMRWVQAEGKFQGSPVAYGAGMGFLIGAVIRTAGSLFQLIIAAAMASNGSGNDVSASQAAGAIGAVGSTLGLLTAPFVGGFLGCVGGLIAGAMMPQTTKTN